LSDGRPWGLWISFDLFSGVALAAGGFVVAGTFYILHRDKYHPVVRSAILTAFLGYIMVILALLVDLGQPWRIWHMIIYWNPHSPLFEVGWCVMLYTTVLALEVSPMVFERLNRPTPLRIIGSISIVLVIAGIVLSTLHQSSLGSVLLMMPETINPLWYTPIMPLLFFLTAITVGLAMTIVESTLSGRSFGHETAQDVLAGLGKAIPYVLGLYLVLKLADLVLAGDLDLIFTDTPYNILFLVEIIVGVVLPIILLSLASVRQSRSKLFWSAMLVVVGLVLNRFNASWFGLAPRPGTTYSPHWMEVVITVGIWSAGLLALALAIRYLPVIQHEPAVETG
jgi:Ni/Fe-hydrogenase subunit HybB-like protein